MDRDGRPVRPYCLTVYQTVDQVDLSAGQNFTTLIAPLIITMFSIFHG